MYQTDRKQTMPLIKGCRRTTAKTRNRNDKVAQRSLVAVKEKDSVSDSNEDPNFPKPEYAGVAIVVSESFEPMDYQLSPSVGWDEAPRPWLEQIKASEASSERRESLDEVEAYLATDGNDTNDLFCSPMIQHPGESQDATDTQGNAPETHHTEDLYPDLKSEVGVSETLKTEDLYPDLKSEVGVSDEDGSECIAPESDEQIVNKMLCQSPMKNSTRSKSRKVRVPEPLIPSDS